MTERRQPRFRASPLELRLYVVALLAAVYTMSWRAIGGHAAVADPVVARPVVARPVVARPAIVLPAGWQLASQLPPSTQPARTIHVPKRRVPRVRTRSS